MRKPKHYSVLEVLNFSDVGLTFEFYTTKQSNFVVDELESLTGKNVILTNENTYSPSYSNAILIKEYEAKRSRYQFTIAQQNYHSVLPIIDVVTGWISEHCETTYDTQLKVSLSFNHRHLETLTSISQMNPTRLLLKFDENEVYSRFPHQKGSPYALSIKHLAPIANYINESEISKNINYILTTPYAEFYGINFKDYTRGILEMNYIGGKDYPVQNKEIKDLLEYFIIKTYQTLNEDEDYNDFEQFEIKRLTEGFDKFQMAFYNPEIFLKEFSNIKAYVDLKTSEQTLKTYWSVIRKPLFEMIVNGGLREGQFNYDTQLGRFQLRKGRVGGISLQNMDLVSCDVTGILENCSLITCDVRKARIYNSNFIKANQVTESYLKGVTLNAGNELNKCYVLNNEEIVNCKINESVVKYATIGKHAKVDDQSTIIVNELSLPAPSNAVHVERIRDYSWIKDMNKNPISGFANAYSKDKYYKNITKDEEIS